jgi:hypothetical protein
MLSKNDFAPPSAQKLIQAQAPMRKLIQKSILWDAIVPSFDSTDFWRILFRQHRSEAE